MPDTATPNWTATSTVREVPEEHRLRRRFETSNYIVVKLMLVMEGNLKSELPHQCGVTAVQRKWTRESAKIIPGRGPHKTVIRLE